MGFDFIDKGKGSHFLWVRDSDEMVIPVPNHGKKDIRKGTVHAIVTEAGLKNIHDLDKL